MKIRALALRAYQRNARTFGGGGIDVTGWHASCTIQGVSGMRRVVPSDDVEAWLASMSGGEGTVTGFDATGWPDSTWILHAMWELTGPERVTDEERDRALVHFDAHGEPTDNSGDVRMSRHSGGFSIAPGDGWTRITWGAFETLMPACADPAERRSAPPSGRWFWTSLIPSRFILPPEGSLDAISFRSLLELLASDAAAGFETECWAYYAGLTGRWNQPFEGRVFDGALEAIAAFVTGPDREVCTPSNFWAADKSWFVWTDWDLWATKVSGSSELIGALRAHPDIETLDWAPEL